MPLHPEIELTIKLDNITGNHEFDRNALRTLLLDRLVGEKAGTGKGEDTSKYRYNVESLSCGNRIYLTRPVPLKKGFDFIIHVENYTFMNRKDNPRHDDILNDLKNKKQEDNAKYEQLLLLIDSVFHCKEPTDIFLQPSELLFEKGFPEKIHYSTVKAYLSDLVETNYTFAN